MPDLRTLLGMKLVLCHGTFDFPHYGHLKHFEEARTHGDYLVVTITADAFVNRGPGRPVTKEYERKAVISAWRCVDYAEILYEKTGLSAIRTFRPAVYCKGGDYKDEDRHGSLEAEKKEVEKYGGKLIITSRLPGYSSTILIERIKKCGMT